MTRDEALWKARNAADDEAKTWWRETGNGGTTFNWPERFLASLAASGYAVVPLIDKFKLQALENGGVDNWDWYGDAMEEAENMLAAAQEDSHD